MAGMRRLGGLLVMVVGGHFGGCSSLPCEETLTCAPPGRESGGGAGDEPSEVTAGAGGSGGPEAGRSGLGAGTSAGGGSGRRSQNGESGAPPLGGEPGLRGEAGDAGGDGLVVGPRVTTVSPRDGAVGIFSDQVIQLKFSEPMDSDSVLPELTLSDFLSDDLQLSWNAEQTTLTITPSGGFTYAIGPDDTIQPRTFTLALGAHARAKDGVELGKAFESSFSTLRRIKRTFVPTVYGYDTYGGTSGMKVHPCESGDDLVYAGSFSNLAAVGTNLGFVAFDAAELGDPAVIASREKAIFSGQQLDPTGAFYSGGSVLLDKLTYAIIDNEAAAIPVTDELGTYVASAATSTPTLDITKVFWNDYSQGGQRQLYRLSPVGNQDNTRAQFRCDGFAVEVTYLIP
jgi:hypothetical protein